MHPALVGLDFRLSVRSDLVLPQQESLSGGGARAHFLISAKVISCPNRADGEDFLYNYSFFNFNVFFNSFYLKTLLLLTGQISSDLMRLWTDSQ